MKLQFIGANHEVTGSCHYLQAGDSYMLVDYGMEQGVNRFENCPLPVPESQINFVFLTHGHIDHSGMLEEQEGKTPCRNRSGGAVVYDGGCDRHHQLYRTMPVWERIGNKR